MEGRKTKGKQKIEMKKIENDDDRMITFSKRRSGIYKKMNELVTMCGAEAGFLVFSGAGTPFTFANPSMETVANRLVNPNHQPPRDDALLLTEAYRRQRIDELIRDYEKLAEELEVEKEREKILEKSAEEKELSKCWWKAPVEDLTEEESRRMHDKFVELHDMFCDMVLERLRLSGEGSSSGVDPNRLVDPSNLNAANPSSSVPPRDSVGGDQSGGI